MSLALAEVLIEIQLDALGQPAESRAINLVTSVLVFAPFAILVYKLWLGRNWARMTYLVLTILGLVVTVPDLLAELDYAPIQGAISAVAIAIQLVGVYLVFTFPGKTWFGGRPPSL